MRRKRSTEIVPFGAPFSLTTPLGIKREAKLSLAYDMTLKLLLFAIIYMITDS